MNICISIIIPMYNVEMYIEECLGSIINQTLYDIEILCIDDGSFDKTISIVEEVIKKDYRIKLLKHSHEGVSFARNAGIEIACGKYIMFVDGDDILCDSSVLETLYVNAEVNKVSICGGNIIQFEKEWVKGVKYPFNKVPIFIRNEEKSFDTYGNPYGFTRFIYNRLFLLRNNVRFPYYDNWEDPVFLAIALSNAERFYVIKQYVYCYRKGIHKKDYRVKDIVDYLSASVDLMRIGYENNNDALQENTLDVLHMNELKLLQIYKYNPSILQEKLDRMQKWVLCSVSDSEKSVFLKEGYYRRKMEDFNSCEKKFIDKCVKRKIVIYGAGDYGNRLFGLLKKYEIKVDGFSVTCMEKNVEYSYDVPVKSIDIWLRDSDIHEKSFVISIYDDIQREKIKSRLMSENLNVIDMNVDLLEKLEV
ncbi:glycosyltransferase family 2 protein [Selenomonas sp. AB3002]|uniref:glycosyltransferase family 2 protein n=1 Tax=Selenomonas sp. AB3002 TaxID=1392502 RepID=UPI0004959E3C